MEENKKKNPAVENGNKEGGNGGNGGGGDYLQSVLNKSQQNLTPEQKLHMLEEAEAKAIADEKSAKFAGIMCAANLAAGIPYVIRQNVPREGQTTFHDEIYGDITVPNCELDDMILIKSDGYPTYNFANVVDDHL